MFDHHPLRGLRRGHGSQRIVSLDDADNGDVAARFVVCGPQLESLVELSKLRRNSDLRIRPAGFPRTTNRGTPLGMPVASVLLAQAGATVWEVYADGTTRRIDAPVADPTHLSRTQLADGLRWMRGRQITLLAIGRDERRGHALFWDATQTPVRSRLRV